MVLIVCGFAAVAPSPIVVNEILVSPSQLEFVEILNRSDRPVDLGSWTLADDAARPVALAPRGVIAGPGALVALVRNAAAFAAAWPGVPYIEVAGWPALNDDGDRVSLEGPGGVDHVPYEASWGPRGRSLERRDPCGPSDHPVNWGPSEDPSGASPGRENSLHAPDRTPPRLVLVDGSVPQGLEAWFDEPVGGGRFTTGGIVLAATFDRSRRVVLPGAASAVSIRAEAVEDLFGNVLDAATGAVARAPTSASLRLSEILTAPLQDPYDGEPDGPPFVEVAVMGTSPVSLRDLRLAARQDESGTGPATDPVRPPAGIGPGERAVLHAGPPEAFRAAWPDAAATAVALEPWPFPRAPATIRLLDPAGTEIDRVDASEEWYGSDAAGRSLERIDLASGSSPWNWTASTDARGATPGLRNTAETAPRGRPAGPGDLVVSEILYDPGPGGAPEFLELEVIATAAIDPNGLLLVVGAAGSSPDTMRIAHAPRAWLPGMFAVVAGGPGTAAERLAAIETSLPGSAGRLEPADVLLLGRALTNGAGAASLLAADGTIIDQVAYSDAWHHPALHVTAGVSLERVDPRGSAAEPSNWSSSLHPDGATPGFRDRPPPAGAPDDHAEVLSAEPTVFYPRDFSRTGHTAIRIRIRNPPGVADLSVFDLAGRRVRVLSAGRAAYDVSTLYWDGLDDAGVLLPAGPYVVFSRIADADGRVRHARTVVVLAR